MKVSIVILRVLVKFIYRLQCNVNGHLFLLLVVKFNYDVFNSLSVVNFL